MLLRRFVSPDSVTPGEVDADMFGTTDVETPMTHFATPVLKQAGIPIAPIEYVVEATVRCATDENVWGKHHAIFAHHIPPARKHSRAALWTNENDRTFYIRDARRPQRWWRRRSRWAGREIVLHGSVW
jgi:hypothetical protein